MARPDLTSLFQDFRVLEREEVTTLFEAFDVQEKPQENILAISPATLEEIQKAVKIAAHNCIPILTTPLEPFGSYGSTDYLLLDFRESREISQIDFRNLVASVGRGVTLTEFSQTLKQHKLKCAVPVFPTSPYVLESSLNRDITFQAVKHHEAKAFCHTVVLSNGEIHNTGAKALGEGVMATMARDCGPCLSRWYFGAQDSFGIPVEQQALTYPCYDSHQVTLVGFEELSQALLFMKEVGVRDLAAELFAMNRAAMSSLCGLDAADTSTWTVAVGSDTFEELCDYQQETIRSLGISKYSGRLREEGTDAILRLVEMPRQDVRAGRISYFSHFTKVCELVKLTGERIDGSCPTIVVAYQASRSYVVLQELPPDPVVIQQISEALYRAGGFFDLPTGKLQKTILGEDPTYLAQIKKIKSFMDPQNILNPFPSTGA